MKLFVVALLVAVAAADRLENTYLPPNSAKTAGGSGNFLNTPFGGGSSSGSAFGSRSGSAGGGAGGAAAYSGPTQAPIGIIRYNNENNGDGTYQFDFETENRIQAQESGRAGESSSVQGSFSYTGDDGQTYSINYVADENGFRPEGAHLPTAPPVPEEILKALEQNAADEAAGIVDDGQYRAEPAPSVANRQGGGGGGGAGGYGGSGSGNAGGAPSRQYLAPKPGSNQGGQGGYKY